MSQRNFEQLETRRMMANAPQPVDLIVNGTDAPDLITITQAGNTVTVNNNGVTSTHAAVGHYTPGPTPADQAPVPGLKKIYVHGLDGNDQIIADNTVQVPLEVWGGFGIDTIKGGAKDDMLMGPKKRPANGGTGDASEYIADEIHGNNGNDQVCAGAFAWNSTLNGNAGNDTIRGSTAPDTIDGGLGNDNIIAGDGGDKVTAGPMLLKIGQGEDKDSVDSGPGNDTVNGGSGHDMLITWAGYDVVDGGIGNDTISTGDGGDIVTGGAGNDTITTGRGNDRATGDDGNDTLVGGNDRDTLYGNAGNDVVMGGIGTDQMVGGEGVDEVSYDDHFKPVRIALAGAAINGEAGENDSIGSTFEIARGGSGNDTITGTNGANTLFGESGDDSIRGGKGNDSLYGDFGNDSMWGEDGNDNMDGYLGDDAMYAGKGNDTVIGHYGQDTLVGIGGGTDSLVGGVGSDIYVADKNDDTTDYRNNVAEKDALHKLNAFHNGASVEPEGQDISDPSLEGFAAHYDKRFSNIPLFHTGGPNADDVQQGQLGDCYFLAGLSAIAKSPREGIIERNIVELGDGTYMVKMFDDATPKWYRVDNQLPIKDKTFEELAFASTWNGAESSMWVPILEKAFAYHRTGVGKYEEIVRDNDWFDPGMGYEAYDVFGFTHDTDEVIWNDLEDYMQKMRNYLMAGGAVTATTDPPWLGCDITAFHAYSVEKVSADLKWVTIRNPWGVDDDGWEDGADDGRFKVSAEQFDDDFFFVCYSNL